MPWRRVIIILIIATTFAYYIVGWITVSTRAHTHCENRRPWHEMKAETHSMRSRKLAIIVPVHQGDQDRAIHSLQKWPSKCHPVTMKNMDLIIYKAENTANEVDLIARITGDLAKCFRAISVVSGNLRPEENVYPKGASVQFYKLFLDPVVREHVIDYDALAIIEWDVIVAHDSSFERLYMSTFMSTEPFWIKGSTLAESEFLGTASLPEKWHILGHLNGNAIYNNTDPAFIEFVNFTLGRWGFTYSYDVALWATISDFPYSWPLWQRYSSKFVATNLILNVGFRDVSDLDILRASAVDTLFIHGSTKSLGSVSNHATELSKHQRSITGCTEACGSLDRIGGPPGSFTICDATCLDQEPAGGSIFKRSGCGAGNPSIFGPACRLCSDELVENKYRDWQNVVPNSTVRASDMHMTTSIAKGPSEPMNCSQECREDGDTICDRRCGHGLYGDFHCNWRGLGKACRFCFRNEVAARLADKVAITMGGNVVMCSTREPPLVERNKAMVVSAETTDNFPGYSREGPAGTKRSLIDSSSSKGVNTKSSLEFNPSRAEFASNIAIGQICVFIPGYPEFDLVTEVSVRSINHFMPGVRVVVATHPTSFNVYNSTLKQVHGVSIIKAPYVRFAAVEADLACGRDTRLIFYMTPGELLSRSFTSKDTHSPKGDLLVMYTDVENLSGTSFRRSMGSASLLGFHAPLFSLGTDLILPVEVNKYLREKLIALGSAKNVNGSKNKEGMHTFQLIYSVLQNISKEVQAYATIHIPEVLAAVAFVVNLDGVQFVNLRQWNHRHMFRDISIWDVPLIKPRFGCMINTRNLNKRTIENELNSWVAAFTRGARCYRGFLH